MFYKSGILFKSTMLDRFEKYGVRHGFSCREGGVSTLEHTSTLNICKNLGDSDETVKKNIDILSRAISEDRYGMECSVTVHQIHSSKVRVVDLSNAGEGATKESGDDGDGFATKEHGIIPIIKTADCTPILLCGLDAEENPVIAAVHAGWRGTVNGIAAVAVDRMVNLGAVRESIVAAVGAHIGVCCYEVGDDFVREVEDRCGEYFVGRHIDFFSYENPHANLSSMNREFLLNAGVLEENIDFSEDCTCCNTKTYFSHRGMHGKRGIMGSGITII